MLQCVVGLLFCSVLQWCVKGPMMAMSFNACCSELQCVAVCCSVLQCVAMCCNVLQCVAVCGEYAYDGCVLQRVLQCGVTCCSVLQCVAVCCSVLQCVVNVPMMAVSSDEGCSVLQVYCVAVCCSVLQCVAV